MQRHLCIFLPSLDGGGAEKVMLALAGRFVARGIRCDLVIAMNKGRLLDQVPPGVRLVPLGKSKTIKATFALASYLRRERPQALLSTIFPANSTALLARLLASRACRIVLREANQTEFDVASDNTARAHLNRLVLTWLYRRADAVVAVAENVGHGLIEARLVDKSRLHVIRNPAPAPRPPQAPDAASGARPLIVACGRLEPQKDHATLLRAFAKVRARVAAALLILGEGSLLPELQNQARELGIDESVTFAGYTHDPQDQMRKANLFVHPSRFEGMSNVLIEALACGCPIVATDCPGGTREVLADGKYGSLVPVGDETALADAMLRVLLGEVTFPDASEYLRQFNIEHVADAYLSVLFPPCGEA